MGYRLATPEEVRRAGIRPLAPSQGRGDSKHSRYASPNIVRRLRSDAAWPAGPGTHLRSQLVHHAKVCMMVTRRALPLNARQHWAHDCDGIAWHVDDPANRSKAVQQLTRNNVWDNASRHGAAFSATVPFVRSAPAHALPAAVAVAANEGGLSLKGTTLFLDVGQRCGCTSASGAISSSRCGKASIWVSWTGCPRCETWSFGRRRVAIKPRS